MAEAIVAPQSALGEIDHIYGDVVQFDGAEHLTYSGLFDRYAASPFGLHHADQALRYSNRYAYDPATMLADLGDNVHPIRHMQYTEEVIFRPLAEMQSDPASGAVELLTLDDIAVGRIAALLHDIGECEHPDIEAACGTVIGDVNYFLKTADHEQDEARIRRFLYSTLFHDVIGELMVRVEDTIAQPDSSFVGQTFNSAEKIGYYLADITAGQAALGLKDTITTEADELRFEQLKRMSTSEIPRWQPWMESNAERFPYIGRLLLETTPIAETIMTELA